MTRSGMGQIPWGAIVQGVVQIGLTTFQLIAQEIQSNKARKQYRHDVARANAARAQDLAVAADKTQALKDLVNTASGGAIVPPPSAGPVLVSGGYGKYILIGGALLGGYLLFGGSRK